MTKKLARKVRRVLRIGDYIVLDKGPESSHVTTSELL